jgi:putative spermidine/putrescine transport system substrate-binding protein/spermidine/putrescine transport system substrate-binding protein
MNRWCSFRQAKRIFLIAGVAACALAFAAGDLRAETELRMLTWEGYTEDAMIKAFEEENDVTVTRTYVGSNDEYMAKLAAGEGDYDIVTIVSSLAQRAIDAGFVEPVDLAAIPNYSQIFKDIQRLPFNEKDGEVYGVPFIWGLIPITVNADVIPDRTDRGVLFDPQYAGKIAIWDDVNVIGEVATYLGYEDIWNLTDEQLEAVKQKMIEQKPLVRTYFTNAGEAVDLFLNGEIVMAPGWEYITQALLKEGFPARQFYPDENPIGFVDSNFLVKGTEHRDLALKFMNYLIAAEPQATMGELSGWTPTNPESKQYMSPEVWQRLLMDELPTYLKTVKFWEDIPRRAKYLEILNEVKAAPVQ